MSITLTRSVSFDVVTEESAEDGEVAKSGWVLDEEPITFRQALAEIEGRGYPLSLSVRSDALTVYHEADCDYMTGEYTADTTHFQGDPRAITRLARALSRKYRLRY